MKEVTIQIKFIDESVETVNKTYSGIKSTITDEQIANFAQFIQQLTNDTISNVYKMTKENIDF